MMSYRILAAAGVASLALLLGACASSPSQKTANNNQPQSHQVCTYQSTIGSHIGNRECMSRRAYDAQQKANMKKTQSQMDQQQNASDGGGGR